MGCILVSELRKLSKISIESVENTDSFDEFKRYLHVERAIESDLKALITLIAGVNHKQLVMLCGSAGDGKSHLLSYLIHTQDNLLIHYTPINDATESDAPDKTAIESLSHKLNAFRDDHLYDGNNEKIILAINLGMLNNFIDSEEGGAFSELKKYVNKNNIFTSAPSLDIDRNGLFQHVNFSDYQLFTLNSSGAKSDYLVMLFQRIFANNDDNPFFSAYIQCTTCPHHTRCPIRHNYEFLFNDVVQKQIIQRVIEVCIKDKLVVTSRDILNFIYEIIVSPDFDEKEFWATMSNSLQFIKTYLSYTTPMLMLDNVGASSLIDHITAHNLTVERKEQTDVSVLQFYASEDISSVINDALAGSPYGYTLSTYDLSVIDNTKEEQKKLLFKFKVHYQELTGAQPSENEGIFKAFIRDLYNVYAGRKQQLKELYSAVINSIYNWEGAYGPDYICIDDANERYIMLEQLSIKPFPIIGQAEGDEVVKFSPVLKVQFKNEQETDIVLLQIDYVLYKLIIAMQDGYRPTSQDRNIHADFVSNINVLADFGNKKNRIIIISKANDRSRRFAFEENEFGYSFKAVSI